MSDHIRGASRVRGRPRRPWLALAVAAALASTAAAQTTILPGAPDTSNLSMPEALERARTAIETMRATHRFAVQRLESARQQNDILDVNCVNEKLGSIKQLLKLSEQSDVDLNEAAARKDRETVDYLYTKIAIISGRVENLRTEVEGCSGEASQYTAKTVVERSIDDDIRSDDPATEDGADAVALASDESSRETPRSPSEAAQ